LRFLWQIDGATVKSALRVSPQCSLLISNWCGDDTKNVVA